ncbi:hypothetical protein [Paenarthrobacter sp. TA1.8]|uniref:hypothetical protein n=1 Tax=Paenarthrobacter sp. TA1.8 TaxID=3400219 RepID=UPI003B436B12
MESSTVNGIETITLSQRWDPQGQAYRVICHHCKTAEEFHREPGQDCTDTFKRKTMWQVAHRKSHEPAPVRIDSYGTIPLF